MTTPILLVEDDPSAQDLIRALCETRGHEVDVAADGFLGLRLLSERRHAIVLIDYHLPEMDGYALARLMREIARPDERIRLVGITADAHGLVSRRGADALFDAILVKPVVPETLFSTLDRLTRPDAPPAPAIAATPADALWQRRGLPGRPRAILCPEPGPDQVVAVGQVFELVASHETCDLVLVADEAGIDALRGLRARGNARLVPSVDLTGRLSGVCDFDFRVGDADSWSALARAQGAFAARCTALHPTAREAIDPADRLLALLHVADRGLALHRCGAEPAPFAYETGHAPAERMTAILALMQSGFVTCEPTAEGVAVRITEAGRRNLTDGRASPPPPSATAPEHTRSIARAAEPVDGCPTQGEPRPYPQDADGGPVADDGKMEALRGLIGAQPVARLHERLIEQLENAFAAEAPPATIAHEAHVLISMAGTLGFERLSMACRALQAAIAEGGDVSGRLALARQAGTEVRTWRSGT